MAREIAAIAEDERLRLAEASSAALERLLSDWRSLARMRADLSLAGCELRTTDWEWLCARREPLLLALPLTVSSLALIARLASCGNHTLCVEATPVTGGLLRLIAAGQDGSPILMMSAPELVAHCRASRTQRPAFYVTFPDHHLASEATSRPFPFCGLEHHVPLTEAVLYFLGVVPLVAFQDGPDHTTTLVVYDAPPSQPARENDARKIIEWILAATEAFALARPDAMLSWAAMADRTARAVHNRRNVNSRAVEGFLRAWRQDDPAVADRLDEAIAQLIFLRSSRGAGSGAVE